MLPALGRSSMPDLGGSSLPEIGLSGSFDHVPSALWEEKARRRTSKAVGGSAKTRRSEPAQRADPALDAKLVELVEWVRESAVDPAEDGLSSERAVQLYTRAIGELQELMKAQSRPLADTFEILFQGYRQASTKSSAATYVNEVSRLAETEGRLAAEAEASLHKTSEKLEEARFSLRVEEQKVEALTAKVDRLEIELQGTIDAKDAAGYQLPAMQKLIDKEKAECAVLAEQFDLLTAEHEETKRRLLTAQQRNLELEEKLQQHNIEAGETTTTGIDSPRTLQKEAEARLAERDDDVKKLEAQITRMKLEHAQKILALEQQIGPEAGQSNLIGSRPPGSGIPGPRNNRIADQEDPEPEDPEDVAPHNPVLAASLDEFWGMAPPIEQPGDEASPRSVSTCASSYSAYGRPDTSESLGLSEAMMGMGVFGAMDFPEQSRSRLNSRQSSRQSSRHGSRQGSRKGSRQGPRTTSRGSVASRGSQRVITSPTNASAKAKRRRPKDVNVNPVQQETVEKVRKQLKRAQAEVKRLSNDMAHQTTNLNAERKRRKELSQAKAVLDEQVIALQEKTDLKLAELENEKAAVAERMRVIEEERVTLRTKAAKTVQRLKQQNEQQSKRIKEMEHRQARVQSSVGSIMMHVHTARSDMAHVLQTCGSAAPWRGQWRKMLVDSTATDSGVAPMDVTKLLKTCANIVGDRLHMRINYQATAGTEGHPEGWGCKWEPQLAECAYDYFVATFSGDVVAAERELLNFVLGLRLHYVKHSRLRLFGLLTGVVQDVSIGGVQAGGDGAEDILSSRHASDFYLGACATLQRQLHPVEGRQIFTAKQVDKFQRVFNTFDQDGSGSIDTEELAALLKTLKLELDEDRVVDMAKAVDADGSGDMGFDEFLEVIMIVHEMKRLGCPRAEVMLPGDPDAPCFLLERNGEGRHVGKEMADVAVRKLFQGLPSNRLDEIMKRVKQTAYGGMLATTVDPDILLGALMDSWKQEVELAQLTVEKRLSTIFTEAMKRQARADVQVRAHGDPVDQNNGFDASDSTEPEPEVGTEIVSVQGSPREEALAQRTVKLRAAYTRMVAAHSDGTLGLSRGCTPRILSAVFADGIKRWVEAKTLQKQRKCDSGKRSPNQMSIADRPAGGGIEGDPLEEIDPGDIQIGLTSALAGGRSNVAPPEELAQAISEGMLHAGLVAVPPAELYIFPSQEKIAASASKGRRLRRGLS